MYIDPWFNAVSVLNDKIGMCLPWQSYRRGEAVYGMKVNSKHAVAQRYNFYNIQPSAAPLLLLPLGTNKPSRWNTVDEQAELSAPTTQETTASAGFKTNRSGNGKHPPLFAPRQPPRSPCKAVPATLVYRTPSTCAPGNLELMLFKRPRVWSTAVQGPPASSGGPVFGVPSVVRLSTLSRSEGEQPSANHALPTQPPIECPTRCIPCPGCFSLISCSVRSIAS